MKCRNITQFTLLGLSIALVAPIAQATDADMNKCIDRAAQAVSGNKLAGAKSAIPRCWRTLQSSINQQNNIDIEAYSSQLNQIQHDFEQAGGDALGKFLLITEVAPLDTKYHKVLEQMQNELRQLQRAIQKGSSDKTVNRHNERFEGYAKRVKKADPDYDLSSSYALRDQLVAKTAQAKPSATTASVTVSSITTKQAEVDQQVANSSEQSSKQKKKTARSTGNKINDALNKCFSQLDSELQSARNDGFSRQFTRCQRDLQKAINAQDTDNAEHYIAQLDNYHKRGTNELKIALLPPLVFYPLEPIDRKANTQVKNLQNALQQIHRDIFKGAPLASLSNTVTRYERTLQKLQTDYPDYDFSLYTELAARLDAQANAADTEAQKVRQQRLMLQQLDRQLMTLSSQFYITDSYIEQWEEIGPSSEYTEGIAEFRELYADDESIQFSLGFIEKYFAALEENADKHYQKDLLPMLTAMAEYQDNSAQRYFSSAQADKMRDADTQLKALLPRLQNVHGHSEVLKDIIANHQELSAALEQKISTGEATMRQRLESELKDARMPKAASSQDKTHQQQVEEQLAKVIGRTESYGKLISTPIRTNSNWTQENHPLTGLPQLQKTVFHAAMQDPEGNCHIMQLHVERIYTGDGWSDLNLTNWWNEYPIMCSKT
ncbi:hypothetical protein AAOGI_39050 [Agarivorans albus]